MIKLNKKWYLYVIQHSHTDVGYTHRQEIIEHYHAEYIRQVINILDEIYSGRKEQWRGFKWTCEGFWGVEQFLKNADELLTRKFEDAVRKGDIGISGNYLNLTELISYDVLKEQIKKAVDYGKSIGVSIDSAMTADINGYSWGYADALAENGIKNLFSCIHTHHGMFPIKKQRPFYWESPSGNKVLAWIGEHYMFGNELGLIEGQEMSYSIRDEFMDVNTKEALWERSVSRIFQYMRQLEGEDYPYNFVPVMLSGVRTDNAPPNGQIMDFINKWNSYYKEIIEIKMVTLGEFFEIVRKQAAEIPIYRGDWTDWWSDGVGSTPLIVKHFRNAQRIYKLCKLLDPNNEFIDKKMMEEVSEDLILYAEHTWGHASSIREPWSTEVNNLDLRKSSYAIDANKKVYKNLQRLKFLKYNEVSLNASMPLKFKLINPFDHEIHDVVKIYLEYWENIGSNIRVIEDESEKELDFQKEGDIYVTVFLNPKEEKVLKIVKGKNDNDLSNSTILSSNIPTRGAEGITDFRSFFQSKALYLSPEKIESPFFRIEYKINEGIISWIDKKDNIELLRQDRKYNAFTPIYEITPVKTNIAEERRRMGRNRNNFHTNRYVGELTEVNLISSGDVFLKAEFKYKLEGTRYFSLITTVYKELPIVDISIRLNKESIWEPENLYVALPFKVGTSQELWIEKTGCILRPGIDQLPGTCVDFYSIQEGMCYVSDKKILGIATPDTPLIHLGKLEYHEIELHNEKNYDHNKDELYSWVLNNFWETNFKATTGGFYEFNYRIISFDELTSVDKAMKAVYMCNTGILCVRIK